MTRDIPATRDAHATRVDDGAGAECVKGNISHRIDVDAGVRDGRGR